MYYSGAKCNFSMTIARYLLAVFLAVNSTLYFNKSTQCASNNIEEVQVFEQECVFFLSKPFLLADNFQQNKGSSDNQKQEMKRVLLEPQDSLRLNFYDKNGFELVLRGSLQ